MEKIFFSVLFLTLIVVSEVLDFLWRVKVEKILKKRERQIRDISSTVIELNTSLRELRDKKS